MNENDKVYQKFKSYCLELRLPVSRVLWNFIEQTVRKYDQGKKLDHYFDPDFIPEPKVSEPYDDHIKWLKTQPNDKLELMRDDYYKLHIMTKAILDAEDKRNFNMDYTAAWRIYR